MDRLSSVAALLIFVRGLEKGDIALLMIENWQRTVS
jgi:hypothetical protein